jgi:hypothetical protein
MPTWLKEPVLTNPWQARLPQKTISAMPCPMNVRNVRTANRDNFALIKSPVFRGLTA